MNIKKVLSTILVILWMCTIFYFSNQQGIGSSNTSKKISMIIVNVLDIKNEIPDEEKQKLIEMIEPVIRKLAHYTIYMIGGILIMNCTYAFEKEEKKVVIHSGIIGTIYAISDEVHQLFIAGRSGRVADVLIDSIGISTGIAIYLLIKHLVDRTRRKLIKGGD